MAALLLVAVCCGACLVSGAETSGRLQQMARKSVLVFKGEVLSTEPVTNASFRCPQMDVHATRFRVISVLIGTPPAGDVVFEHYAKPPFAWSGPEPPAFYTFAPGQTCLVFAAAMDESDSFYAAPKEDTNDPNVFRQIADSPIGGGGVFRTLDAQPLIRLSVRDAVWQELTLSLDGMQPSNALYAINELEHLSIAGRRDDAWSRSDEFSRAEVLEALLPLLSSTNEAVANQAINCFATETGSLKDTHRAALVKVANYAPGAMTRFVAIRALSGSEGDAVSNSLAELLRDKDERVRVCALTILTRFPRSFAAAEAEARAGDESPFVRSMAADVIGRGKYTEDLPVLVSLFLGSTNLPLSEQRALPGEAMLDPLPSDRDVSGDVHGSATEALVKFDVGQVADILKSNLNDPKYHVRFVAKLAEKDAGPWLTELTNILTARIKSVAEVAKSDPLNPRRFAEPGFATVILNPECRLCWEDVRQFLLAQPSERLAGAECQSLMDLLEAAVQEGPEFDGAPAALVYEVYATKGLKERAAKFRAAHGYSKWRFDEFDQEHSDLNGPANK